MVFLNSAHSIYNDFGALGSVAGVLSVKKNGAGEGNRTLVRSMGSSYSAIELRPLGGEGGIRTPDTREGMHDFESCAFNQALPPLR